jgi:hypothetical protein
MTNTMDSATQIFVVGDEKVLGLLEVWVVVSSEAGRLEAVALVLEAGGLVIVVLEVAGLG